MQCGTSKKYNTHSHLAKSFDQQIDLGTLKSSEVIQHSFSFRQNFERIQSFTDVQFSLFLRTISFFFLHTGGAISIPLAQMLVQQPFDDIIDTFGVNLALIFLRSLSSARVDALTSTVVLRSIGDAESVSM
jgi:hypothetical protein